jgi:hypothetical protein
MINRLDRYILWAMERYRQQDNPADYAHEPRPKKKIRGYVSLSQSDWPRLINGGPSRHGPAVQFGKRIRSRRRK